MKELNIYLTFNGTCESALNFYKECLNGEIAFISHFDDDPSRVMHAQFKAPEKIFFMASDCPSQQEVISSNQVALSLNLDDESDQKVIFDKLSQGGEIVRKLCRNSSRS